MRAGVSRLWHRFAVGGVWKCIIAGFGCVIPMLDGMLLISAKRDLIADAFESQKPSLPTQSWFEWRKLPSLRQRAAQGG